MQSSVALILHPNSGIEIFLLAKVMPVWVVSSNINEQVVHEAQKSVKEGQITLLHLLPGESSDDLLARAIYAIDEHHGETNQFPYEILWVHGTKKIIPDQLAAELGFKSIIATIDGFKAEKSS